VLGQSGHISIKVFNILGEEVITLLDENISAGRHSVSWNGRSSDGREVSSGVYFLKLEAGDVIQSHKMMIIR
jgi:flagellar hook assembly protein FlgD